MERLGVEFSLVIGVLFIQAFLGIKHSEGKRKDGDVMDLSVCIPIYYAWSQNTRKTSNGRIPF